VRSPKGIIDRPKVVRTDAALSATGLCRHRWPGIAGDDPRPWWPNRNDEGAGSSCRAGGEAAGMTNGHGRGWVVLESNSLIRTIQSKKAH